MEELITRLKRKEQRGSKPRCHFLTNGSRSVVAERLSALTKRLADVGPHDHWMPNGFTDLQEAQLHHATSLLEGSISEELKRWWLGPARKRAMTPNFDIASTCKIDGVRGLLLVEAKAHDEELKKEAVGRLLGLKPSKDRQSSHGTIGAAIEEARSALEHATHLPWSISRDTHYQMSNRFAWAWKLTELGVPVVLVYLGFLNADEMTDRGRPFRSHADWEALVKFHSRPLFPPEVWSQRWLVGSQPLIPLILSVDQALAS